MESQASKLKVLFDLGLTLVQAKLFLALVESGPSRIAAISKISKVARPEIYRNMSKLQRLGLVEKIIQTPIEYRAISMSRGISLLLETKTRQYTKVRAEAMLLLDAAKTEKPEINQQMETSEFVLVPRRTVIERIRSAVEEAQLSIDLVLSWKRFAAGIVSAFAESIEVAWAKEVRIRFILESPLESVTAKQLIKFCRAKPFTQLRFIPHYPKTIFGIYDKKEIFIIAKSRTDMPGSPALWSTNQSLISGVQDYFEKLWSSAMEQTQFKKCN